LTQTLWRKYVDLTIDAVQFEVKTANKNFLLSRLSKALAINVENAILYLQSNASIERKMLAADMFAHGLREYANRASEFLGKVHEIPDIFVGKLLSGCLRSEVDGVLLCDRVVKWLNENVGSEDYKQMMGVPKKRPNRRAELLATSALTAVVRAEITK
jgi:hypothetical protein